MWLTLSGLPASCRTAACTTVQSECLFWHRLQCTSSPCACFPKLACSLLYSRHLCRTHLWHHALQEATAKIDEYARGMISGSGSTLFEELGLYYIGPIDGHNMDDLVAVLEGEGDMSRCRCVRRLACCQAEG